MVILKIFSKSRVQKEKKISFHCSYTFAYNYVIVRSQLLRKVEKKLKFFLVARPIRGGGDKGLATKKKELYFFAASLTRTFNQYQTVKFSRQNKGFSLPKE